MDKLYLSSPISLKSILPPITLIETHTHPYTHTHTHSHTGPSKHKCLRSHPSNFGDAEQFLKCMDSLIMQQYKQGKKQT